MAILAGGAGASVALGESSAASWRERAEAFFWMVGLKWKRDLGWILARVVESFSSRPLIA